MAKNKQAVDSFEDGRSVRRTKTALRNSLIELMKTRSILRISVKDICDKADVGRSTFYAHYESQFDLLEQIQTECLSVFEEKMMNQPLRKLSKQEITNKFEKVFEYIAENSHSIQTLLSENGDISFQKKVIRDLINYLKKAKKHFPDNSINEEIRECYSIFIVYGSIALVQNWLKNNMHIPVSELAKLFVSLTSDMK